MPGTSNDGVRRLRRLIDDSIDGATEADAVSMTKDRERSLLASLSQVLREIRRWNHKQLRDSGLEDDGDEVEDERKESEGIDSRGGWLKLETEDEDCLLKIVAKLIFLLNAEGQYVRQLAGNTLVAASEFIASSVRVWQKFIHLLCDCFVLAFPNILPYSSPLAFEVGKLSCDRSTFDVLNSQLKNSSWNTGAGILGVFHAILKYLKEQNDKHLLESYMDALDSCISKFSWEMLDTIQVRRSYMDCINSGKGTFLTKHSVQTEPRILFLGNLVQLLSSLVDPSGLGEAPADFQYKNPILHNVLDLVPKVLHWCLFHEDWKWKSLQIFLYLRHKTLMLMIRLSSQIRFESTTLFLWLELLHEYFKDLLMEPIYLLHSSVDNSLEGSPFQSSFDDQETKRPSRHLRGQALFLFLRCCLGMIAHQEAPDFDCICMQQTSCSTPNVNTAEYCCARSRGLLQLYEWLQVQVSFDMIGQPKVHVKNCIVFSSFFIQLYMHEDDMLFEVLLLLLSIFNCADRVAKVVPGSQDAKDDALSHVSNFFNPVILFFVFLANLQYDHQLLLDYLISKDTGTNCAEYLLRCLREVCSSWDFFLDLSSDQDTVRHICKRPKLISKSLVSNEGSSACGEDGCALPFEEHNNDYNPAGNCSGYESLDFGAAKSCLISLKDALKKLHRKNLFPYNPKVLLKRLTRFEELCNEHGDFLERDMYLKKQNGFSLQP